jgi:phage gp46-like protein
MTLVTRMSLTLGTLLSLIAVTPAVARPAAADEPVRLRVSTFPAPPGPGWIELRLVAESRERPWRGDVTVAGQAGSVRIKLAVPDHGQRKVALPFRVGGADRALDVLVDRTVAARVEVVPNSVKAGRLLIASRGRFEEESTTMTAGGEDRATNVALERLPETWRVYEAFGLVVLPSGGETDLRPAQEAALEHWLRWGGAVGSSGGRRTTVRPFGAGVAIAGADALEVDRAHDRWRRTSTRDLGREALRAWDDSSPARPPSSGPTFDLRLVVGGYLGTLAIAGCVVARSSGARRVGLQTAMLLIVAGSLATWSVPQAGGPMLLVVEEVALVLARADGGSTHVSSAVHVRAQRRGTSRFAPRLEGPIVYEARAPAAAGRPERAVRWDPDARVWERRWALGETAALRVDGLGPALHIRTVAQGPRAWDVENQGQHRLRSAVLLAGDGRFHALGDLAPGARRRLELDGTAPAPAGEADLEFWRPLLSRVAIGTNALAPVVLAVLEPPLAALDFLDRDVRVTSTNHLALSLPIAPTSSWR